MTERYELSEHLDAIRAAGLGEHADAIEGLFRYWWIDGYHNDSSRDTCRCGLSHAWEPKERLAEEARIAARSWNSAERRLIRMAAVTDEDIDEHIRTTPGMKSVQERRENMRQQRDEARAQVEKMGLPA